ncbi:MAG: BlaI/MecI/CopY family transcriptional regulator [Deinococcota bacterium]
MPRPKQDVPTDREMEILQVLWANGPLGTQKIVTLLNQDRTKKLAYSSVHTILSIMLKKGLLVKGQGNQKHILSPAQSKEEIEAKLIKRLKQTVFGNSTMRLVTRALSTHATSPKDLAKIQELLDTLEEKTRDD